MPGFHFVAEVTRSPPSQFGTASPSDTARASGSSHRHVTNPTTHATAAGMRPGGPGFAANNPPSQYRFSSAWTDSSPDSSRFTSIRSPPPLANDRYELQGGMEALPMAAGCNSDFDDYFQLKEQRRTFSTDHDAHPGSQGQAGEQNAGSNRPGVLNQIINLVGGVIQFCSRPFRGFQAGGGQGYAFGANGAVSKTDAQMDRAGQTPQDPAASRLSLPGGFPDDNFGVNFLDSIDDERLRLAKRLKTSDSWVLVDRNGDTESRPCTPRVSERRVPTKSPSQIPRPVSRPSLVEPTPARRSLIPVSRRSSINTRRLSQGPSAYASSPASTPMGYARQSFPSSASARQHITTPLSPESQHIINKRRQDELEDEARLRRMSSQMAQMLKEAQAALNSNYTLEDD